MEFNKNAALFLLKQEKRYVFLGCSKNISFYLKSKYLNGQVQTCVVFTEVFPNSNISFTYYILINSPRTYYNVLPVITGSSNLT